jgi:hypothetical protein
MKGTISIFIALLYFINIGSAQFDEMITSGNNTGSYNISVALDHIFISKKNNSIEISEIVVFRNEGCGTKLTGVQVHQIMPDTRRG